MPYGDFRPKPLRSRGYAPPLSAADRVHGHRMPTSRTSALRAPARVEMLGAELRVSLLAGAELRQTTLCRGARRSSSSAWRFSSCTSWASPPASSSSSGRSEINLQAVLSAYACMPLDYACVCPPCLPPRQRAFAVSAAAFAVAFAVGPPTRTESWGSGVLGGAGRGRGCEGEGAESSFLRQM